MNEDEIILRKLEKKYLNTQFLLIEPSYGMITIKIQMDSISKEGKNGLQFHELGKIWQFILEEKNKLHLLIENLKTLSYIKQAIYWSELYLNNQLNNELKELGDKIYKSK